MASVTSLLSWHVCTVMGKPLSSPHRRLLVVIVLLTMVTLTYSAPVLPSAPVGLSTSEVTATSVKLAWESGNKEPVTSYIIQYKPKNEKQTYTEKTDVTDTETVVMGLTPFTVYEFRVVAVNNIGRSASSMPTEVKTRQRVPLQPRNLHGEAITPNTIRLTWSPPDETDTIESYQLYYSDSYFRQIVRISVEASVSGFTLNDLTPNTVYHIQVSAKSKHGEGAKTPTIHVRTLPFVPEKPKKVRVEVINSTAALVKWAPPARNERNGIVRGYRVHYVRVDENERPVGETIYYNVADEGETDVVVTGLQADTRYKFHVVAYTRKGDGIRSKARVVTTKGAVPTPPRNLNVELLEGDPPRVRLTWQRPRETYGAIDRYKIVWGKKGEIYEEKVWPGQKYTFVTGFLDKGSIYEFHVSAKNAVDFGQRAVKTVSTPDGVPRGAPQNFSAVRLSETRVRLSWDLPAKKLRNGEVIMYQITYYKLAEPIYVEDFNTTGKWAEFIGLEMNTDYVCQIKAFTSRGAGPWSNKLHFRTFGQMPPAPKNVKAQRATPTSILVFWDEPAFPVAGYKVYYNMFALPNMDLWQSIEIGPYTVARITGLQEHTIYTVRVQARSVDGRYGNLSNVTQSTYTPKVPPQLRNLHGEALTPNSIRLTWLPPDETIKIENYQLYYNDSYFRENVRVYIDPTATGFTLNDLTPDTVYHIQVSAKSKRGEEAKTPTIQIRTLPFVPGKPKKVRVEAINSTAAFVEWAPPARNEHRGIIRGYRVHYVPVDENETPIGERNYDDVVDGDKTDAVVTGLEADTRYKFHVAAYTRKGDGIRSKAKVVTIERAVPPAPKNVKVQRATPTSMLVFWDEPDVPVAGYKIYYHMFSLPDMDLWPSIEIGPYTVAEITGVHEHVIYAVRVQARSVDGRYGSLSNIIQSIYSPRDKIRSDVVEHFHASSQTSRSISLKWEPPRKPSVNSYRLRMMGTKRYRDKYGSMKTYDHKLEIISVPGSDKEYVVRNLAPKVLFSFNLSAIFLDGSSGPEAFLTAQTLIEAPPVVEPPVIVGVGHGVIKLTLSRASERNGPLSHYLLCVVPESKATKAPNDFTINDLSQDVMEVQFPASEPYIAARFEARYLKSEFELGNGQAYGSYVNRPLDRDQQYKVFFRAYSVDRKLYQSSSYSRPLLDERNNTDPVPPAPRNVKVQRATPTSMSVLWDEPDIPVAGYKVYYNMFAQPDMDLWPSIEIGPYTVAEITGLHEHVIYAVCVQARSVDGRYGNLSNVTQSIYSPRDETRWDVVEHFHASSQTSRSISLKWEPPRKTGVDYYMLRMMGTKRYRDKYGSMMTYDHKLEIIQIPGSDKEYVVRNLAAKVLFSFNLSAIFLDGISGPEAFLTAQTLIEAPPVVEPPVILGVGHGVIKLKLSRASERNGPLSHYLLCVVPESKATKAPNDFTIDDLSKDVMEVQFPASEPYIAARFEARYLKSEFELGNGQAYGSYVNRPLDRDQQYKVFFRAYSVDPKLYRSSSYSRPLSLLDERNNTDPVPPAPRNVKVQRATPTSMSVLWDEPDIPVAGYKVYYNMFAQPDMDLWPSIEIGPYTVAEITGLHEHVIYAVCVQARSVDGRYGNLSNVTQSIYSPRDETRWDVVEHFHASSQTSRSINLKWEPPRKTGVDYYMLRAMGTKRYRDKYGSMMTYDHKLEIIQIPGSDKEYVVRNLAPKVLFSFNLSAIFLDGISGPEAFLTAQTLIEAPPVVEPPVILGVGHGVIKLTLSRASERNGPLSHYLLCVVPESKATKAPNDFTINDLSKDVMEVQFPASEPYIAARFEARYLKSEFELGNGQAYGSYVNRPLDRDQQYKVFFRAYSVDRKLYRSSSYSRPLSLLDERNTDPVPPAPKNVKVQRATPTSLLVFWDEPAFPVAGYKVYYNMFALRNMDLWQSIEIGPYTVARITGLQEHSIYAVRVQARSVDGRYGNLSNITQSTYSPKGRIMQI